MIYGIDDGYTPTSLITTLPRKEIQHHSSSKRPIQARQRLFVFGKCRDCVHFQRHSSRKVNGTSRSRRRVQVRDCEPSEAGHWLSTDQGCRLRLGSSASPRRRRGLEARWESSKFTKQKKTHKLGIEVTGHNTAGQEGCRPLHAVFRRLTLDHPDAASPRQRSIYLKKLGDIHGTALPPRARGNGYGRVVFRRRVDRSLRGGSTWQDGEGNGKM